MAQLITVKPCINCGADQIDDFRYYDGALGYEAIICQKCGYVYDFNGIHPPEEPKMSETKRNGLRYYPIITDGKLQLKQPEVKYSAPSTRSYDFYFEVNHVRKVKCQLCNGHIQRHEFHLMMLKFGSSGGRLHVKCVQEVIRDLTIAERKYQWAQEGKFPWSKFEVTV